MRYVVNVGEMTLYLYVYDIKTDSWQKRKKWKLTHTEMKFIMALDTQHYTRFRDLALILYGTSEVVARNCLRLLKSRIVKKTGMNISTKYRVGYKSLNEVEIC